jgi:hypothetical protein
MYSTYLYWKLLAPCMCWVLYLACFGFCILHVLYMLSYLLVLFWVIKYVLVGLHTMYVCLCLSLCYILLYLTWLLWEFNVLSHFGGVICLFAYHYPKNVCTWERSLRIDIASLSSFYVVCLAHGKFKLYNVH